MSRPYTWDPKVRAYRVKDSRGMTVHRRNKTAAGMTYTNGRKPKPGYSDDALHLMVVGHTGHMNGLAYCTKRNSVKICPCCGQASNRLILNDRGKTRLRILRRRREARLQLIAQPKETRS